MSCLFGIASVFLAGSAMAQRNLFSMENSDVVFELQNRIADSSSDVTAAEYWSLYDTLAGAAHDNAVKVLSLLDLHSSLLKRFHLPNRVLFERPACTMEQSVVDGLKTVVTSVDMEKYASAVIFMLDYYYRVFWLPSGLLTRVFEMHAILIRWGTTQCPSIVSVPFVAMSHA